ncbi:hypothetical protein [Amycolatopsis sp. cmx-11-51]|uniref:hypothetical protein n=1 Tax=Amycolatopsis sp. cmx-11-51 TaxID=2785797 RepID=UPI0039E3755E
MKNPRTGLSWIDGRPPNAGAAAKLLRGLGNGDIALTHEAFHRLQPWRAAGHLRELLMSCGVLPLVDKQICSFERWLGEYLGGISIPDHEQLVRRFATWEVLTRLRRRAAREPLTPSTRYFASGQVKAATQFLGWLANRGRPLDTCCQADIDTWHAGRGEHERGRLRGFCSGPWPASSPGRCGCLLTRSPATPRCPSPSGSRCWAACSPATTCRCGPGSPV